MDIQQYIESGILEEYALGVLPAANRAEVERLVAAHPELQHELNAIISGLDTYAEAHALTPPPGMRERVLAGWQQAIRAEAPGTTQASATAEPPYVAPQPAAAPAPEPVVRPISSAPEPAIREEAPRRGFGWLMAASVALLLSMAGNYVLYNRWQNTETALFAAQNDQARFAATQQAAEKQLSSQGRELAVLRDVQFQSVTLAGTPAAPSAKARVLYNPATKAVYVDVHSLPAPPAGKQYQLWALDNGQPVDAGVLAASTAAGDSLQQMKNIVSAQAFAMTVENEGGSASPTLATMTVLGKLL
ncbi:anti-sigma factor [Hymenobacter psychrotolerans]|uniref:Regulator of SigK n=1 Tax=Hymenobacter psychrotolerans DSM 18569 TaxID=1121959 RepID=A0A1M6T3W6_9BACT|nr:anti-sigma factor [Hymenobacter psychrotolerans]SHK51692.1 Anti-sigma-K factor rskA [Hymenobacter psychrotolerans DSM 18569]